MRLVRLLRLVKMLRVLRGSRILQRWEWTRSSRSQSTRMDNVAAALQSISLDKQRGWLNLG